MNIISKTQRVAVPTILLLAVCLLYAGCSEAARYRVLSFFFDGVPPPKGMEPKETEALAEDRAGQAQTAKTKAAAQKPTVFIYHAPYKDRLCFQCHQAEGSYQAPTAGAKLCQRCHASYFRFEESDWAHGPTAVGDCAFCHEPHKSEYQNLLTADQPDLCWKCHQASDVLAKPYHRQASKEPCSKCHDPHFAGNNLLLADSRSYLRRKQTAKTIQSTHAKWSKNDCTKCHTAQESYELVEDVNTVCLTCHQKVLETVPGQKLHSPVRQEQCVLCHTPHKSSRDHLIRPTAEKICYNCHEPDEIRTGNHPRVNRVDCLLCHAGHSSAREHLLRPDIPLDH
ncbi:MAG: hypothetical protein GWP14_03235 [Actinobacteria bacterium]|nr:hypothetical protein [Actinomycetota bacterium]